MPHGCAGMCVPTQTRRFPQANLESACLAGPRTPALCPERENCFSPCPLLQGKLCLLSVGSISSHLSQTLGWRWPVVTVQAAMASDVPGTWGRRVWLGTFIQGCCAASTRKGQENPALVWQWLRWAVPTQPPMAGWGRGSPGSSVHPKLRLIRVSEVLGSLPVWAVCLGDVMARGGDVQCPGFLLSRQLAGSGRTEPGCCRGGLALSSVLLAPHS